MHSLLNQERIPDLNGIYELADKNGISVTDFSLPACGAVSVMDGDGYCHIGLDNSRYYTQREKKTMLAHELGHCETGAFYNQYTPLSLRSKCERKADEWAIRRCVPLHALKTAVMGGAETVCELAEHFGVSEALIRKALDYYTSLF